MITVASLLAGIPLLSISAPAASAYAYGVDANGGPVTIEHGMGGTLLFFVSLKPDGGGVPGVNVTGHFLEVPGGPESKGISSEHGWVELSVVAPSKEGTYNFSVIALDADGHQASEPGIQVVTVPNFGGMYNAPPTPATGGASPGLRTAMIIGAVGGGIGGLVGVGIAMRAKKRKLPPPAR